MTTMDLGSLFGLDLLGEKCPPLDLLTPAPSSVGGGDEFQDILNLSLQEHGITQEIIVPENIPSWDEDTDEFLQSMLTGSELSPESQLGFGSEAGVLSDTSSDSGVLEDVRMLASPGLDDEGPSRPPGLLSPGLDSPAYSPANSVDLIDYLSNDSDNGESISPLDMAGTTTIILPLIRPGSNPSSTTTTTHSIPVHHHPHHQAPTTTVTVSAHRLVPRDQTATAAATIVGGASAVKRRRVSASSSDSGLEDQQQQQQQSSNNKYPRLELNDEERRMAIKEGMVFPKYYPLSREEERNLKKIRRKIRNKLSAQDSRKRKREYLDNMEDRVKICTDENQELKNKIKALESQNRTLAAQLRRLHQIVVNGGMRQGQTSTALMVLLLSTALFLIPGVRDQADSKPEIDIQRAVKMPPMPGQSRSLLQFNAIETAATDIADMTDFQEEDVKSEPSEETVVQVVGENLLLSHHTDHDYTAAIYGQQQNIKLEPGNPGGSRAWIDEDAPPLGYGSGLKEEETTTHRHMNVNVTSSGQGTRTVVLQIPRDIK